MENLLSTIRTYGIPVATVVLVSVIFLRVALHKPLDKFDAIREANRDG